MSFIYQLDEAWHVTIAPAIDRTYWRMQGITIDGGWRYPSIGRAVRDVQHLRRRSGRRRPSGDYEPFPDSVSAEAWQMVQSLWNVWSSELAGRSLLLEEVARLLARRDVRASVDEMKCVLQYAVLKGDVTLLPAIRLDGPEAHWKCERCQSGRAALQRTACARCGDACMYCHHCLLLGRSRACEPLFQCPARLVRPFEQRMALSSAIGDALSLTPAQQRAASVARAFVNEKRESVLLLWAVTGAGKTEMTFQTIGDVLRRGGRVAVASPRRDVVDELAPRLRQAFPSVRLVKQHGESGETWDKGELVVATVHQLYRAYQTFDLIIVDEVDAYPYRHDNVLQAAVTRALAAGGQQLWLTATPPRKWQRAFRRGTLPGVTVPVRHHGHPLPEPVVFVERCLLKRIQANDPIPPFTRFFQHVEQFGGQAYVFVPGLSIGRAVLTWIETRFPALRATGVSSRDEQRSDKIARFRAGDYRLLVTTTILERGVTVPHAHVLIVHADHPIFDEAALVQMSGRAGRSADYPSGLVYWVGTERTESERRALRHIREMNREAAALGWLHSP